MWPEGLRPSLRIKQILRGDVALEDEEDGIQSACRFFIYQGAVELLSIPGKIARQNALKRIPAKIRPHIEKEAWRIHNMKRTR